MCKEYRTAQDSSLSFKLDLVLKSSFYVDRTHGVQDSVTGVTEYPYDKF